MSGTSPFNKTNVNIFSTVATTVIHEVWIPLSCLILLPFYTIHPLSDKTKCSPVLKKVFVSSADTCTRLTVTVMQNVRLLVLILFSLSYLRRSSLPPPPNPIHPPSLKQLQENLNGQSFMPKVILNCSSFKHGTNMMLFLSWANTSRSRSSDRLR